MTTLNRIIISVLTTIAVGILSPLSRADAAERIAVLVSSSEAPFEETLAGFQGQLARQGQAVEYDVYRLSRSPEQVRQAIETIKKTGVRLIFTLGSIGTDAAVRSISDTPIVACLVLRSHGLAKTPNATGVGLEFPLHVQFTWLKAILPGVKTIGVIYNPEENRKRVEDAYRIAESLGLELEAVEVGSPREIPSALTSLSKRVDALWGLADTMTLSPQLAKYILLDAFRNSIPFVGPSEAWTKAGALYSLDWDYQDLGAQCGDMAVKILRGAPASSLPPVAPRRVLYSINLKTAQQIKVPIHDDIAKKARRIY